MNIFYNQFLWIYNNNDLFKDLNEIDIWYNIKNI